MEVGPVLGQAVSALCEESGLTVAPEAAHYYLRTLLADAEKDADGAVALGREEGERLARACADDFTARRGTAFAATVTTQAAVSAQRRAEAADRRRRDADHRATAERWMRDVCALEANPGAVFDALVLYILHETSQGDEPAAHRETVAALESVLPRSAIAAFAAQPEGDKVAQVEELTRIVWGIRLLNREAKRGGAGVPDVPGDLAATLQAVESLLASQLSASAARCDALAAVPRGKLEEHVCRRQYHHFLTRMEQGAQELSVRTAAVRAEWSALVREITEMVGATVAVPKAIVYPEFIQLAGLWQALVGLLADLEDLRAGLQGLVAHQPDRAPAPPPGDPPPPPAADQVNRSLPDTTSFPTCVYREALADEAAVQYGGFCIVSLVNDEELRPISPRVGYFEMDGHMYGFADTQALHDFGTDPTPFLPPFCISHLARRAALPLLGLDREVPVAVRSLDGTAWVAERRDADAQTGQAEPYKVPQYTWNVWDLRREALRLADRRGRRTQGTQTHASLFRRDTATQTYPPKDAACQTGLSKGTQSLRFARSFGGIRGDPNSKIRSYVVPLSD